MLSWADMLKVFGLEHLSKNAKNLKNWRSLLVGSKREKKRNKKSTDTVKS